MRAELASIEVEKKPAKKVVDAMTLVELPPFEKSSDERVVPSSISKAGGVRRTENAEARRNVPHAGASEGIRCCF